MKPGKIARGFPRPGRLAFAIVVLAILTASCASVGPKTISRDQFDYGAALSNSAKEQLLSNIVRLRYLDTPVFVDVASVINQYSLEGAVELGAGVNSSFIGDDSVSVGGTARYTDRPTITYAPISGRKFAASLLTPISPENLFALIQSGWSAEGIFRLTVKVMNGVENEWGSPSQRRSVDPRFVKLIDVWSRLRKAHVIGLRREGKEGDARIFVYRAVDEVDSPEILHDLEFMLGVLDLDPDAKEFPLNYGFVRDQPDEIVVLTSSIIEIINELAWRVEVPEEHVTEGRTGPTFLEPFADRGPLIRVHSATERPEDSYVAIENRGYWFYIDDRDVASKRTFAVVQILLSLADSGEKARGPVVSIN